jgi:hypothetical protein
MVSGSPPPHDVSAEQQGDDHDATGHAAATSRVHSPGTEAAPTRPRAERNLKVSDDELARRRQEVKTLKEQIHGARPHASDFRNSFSPPSKPPPAFVRHVKTPGGVGSPKASPRFEGINATRGPGSPPQDVSPTIHARRGHFDASTLPRIHDSYEVENLRTKLGEMEAKLLNTQSQLVKERETSRTAKARLAMEMQTRMLSAEDDFVRSKASLELQLQEMQETVHTMTAELESERKQRQLQEIETDKLRRTVTNMSLSMPTEQSILSVGKSQDDEASTSKKQKIQDLCQVNLTLLGQKRSTVKHVVAMNAEIADVCDMLKETIERMKSPGAMDLGDEMLSTENKALLMAQLQAQSKLQLTEAELQNCRQELDDAKAEITALQLQVSEVAFEKTARLEEDIAALKKAHADAITEWSEKLIDNQEDVKKLRAALVQERERSEAQLADMQEELNSVHQSRLSRSVRPDSNDDSLARMQSPEGISMKLDMKMSDVENSVEFVQAVKLDVCSALGISAARIQMHGLRAGSVIVDMAVQQGVNPSDRTPEEILVELVRQMKDPKSELLHGSMTNKTMSIEVYANDSVYQQNIKHNDSACSGYVRSSESSKSSFVCLQVLLTLWYACKYD